MKIREGRWEGCTNNKGGKTMNDITVAMRHNNSVNTLVQALKLSMDKETKEKLWERLVELALPE